MSKVGFLFRYIFMKGMRLVKKRILLLTAVISLLLLTPVHATLTRMANVTPALSFTGTTANCSATIYGGSTNADIAAVISLKNGNDCIKTWKESAVGYLYFTDTVSVTRGQSYTLSVDATIDGKTLPTASTSNTCK